MLFNDLMQQLYIFSFRFIGQIHAAANHQGRVQIHGRNDEGQPRHAAGDIALHKLVVLFQHVRPIGENGLAMHHSLGLSGRPGGEEDKSLILGIGEVQPIVNIFVWLRLKNLIQVQK